MDRKADDSHRAVLRAATDRLRTCLTDAPAGSGETPYLDALVLLAHAASLTKEQLFAAFNDRISEPVLARYQQLIADRCEGIPVSYLRGMKEFFGREFRVGPGVLIPRPDTETLVESALEEVHAVGTLALHVHDCCTGSGCVAITLALEHPCRVTASDTSEEALGYARRNAAQLGGPEIQFWQGDLLSPLRLRVASREVEPPMIITANPPYVADNEVERLSLRGWPEPTLALRGGEDGLAVIRRLAEQATACLPEGGCLMVEIGSDQGASVAGIFDAAGYREVAVVQDLAGRDRVCRGRWYRR